MKNILSVGISIIIFSLLGYLANWVTEEPFNWHIYFDLYAAQWGHIHCRLDVFLNIFLNAITLWGTFLIFIICRAILER